ncbi:MAG: hypothetical protein A3F84_22040 [Candidatus Handelsmanbacteria bacterium RIFCSPLOWO2_12_FULL_64_10]|uniref:Uncharacterized protein n=1 Tax=Handelsmanbacteria sp. (strain RIFCSPLOWO2_12_FULL_64_10) TaxID=1817868 RepID=A0A1F6D0M6_HANXR|nr:MAG: hypothetical protein A3F84_22040 [Candidatus Handelsmanbacteria bacterium RIFCSPLOWO2_12_FULL_64_10]
MQTPFIEINLFKLRLDHIQDLPGLFVGQATGQSVHVRLTPPQFLIIIKQRGFPDCLYGYTHRPGRQRRSFIQLQSSF